MSLPLQVLALPRAQQFRRRLRFGRRPRGAEFHQVCIHGIRGGGLQRGRTGRPFQQIHDYGFARTGARHQARRMLPVASLHDCQLPHRLRFDGFCTASRFPMIHAACGLLPPPLCGCSRNRWASSALCRACWCLVLFPCPLGLRLSVGVGSLKCKPSGISCLMTVQSVKISAVSISICVNANWRT